LEEENTGAGKIGRPFGKGREKTKQEQQKQATRIKAAAGICRN